MTKSRDIASAIPAPSTISSAELGYLDGVTSAIQTQMDAKTAKATLTTTGDIYYASSASTPARLGIGSSAQVLTVAGGVPSWATPSGGGKVLQVVSAMTTTEVSTTSTSLVDSGITLAITPTLATSKVLVMISAATGVYGGGESYIKGAILRGATIILDQFDTSRNTLRLPAGNHNTISGLIYLDSPATTSSTTYKFQVAQANSSTVYMQRASIPSTITLMEIGA